MSFYNYVININKNDLINEVGRLYRKFKGTSTMIPNLGYNGCIWLAGALLLYKYLEDNKKPGSYNFAIAVILPAFNGAPALLFADLMSTALIDLDVIDDWYKIHPYLEETSVIYDGINEYEFSSSRTAKADNQFATMQQLLQRGFDNFVIYCRQQGLFVPAC